MLLIGLLSLLIAVALAAKSYPQQAEGGDSRCSQTLYWSSFTPLLLTRITSLILLFSAALAFNSLYVQAIGSGLGLYNGLFHVTNVTLGMEVFLYITGALILVPWMTSTPGSATAGGSDDVRSVSASDAGVVNEFGLIILFTVLGGSFFMTSADLVSMYLSIELQSFGVYILGALARDSESATSAGLKYFLLGALSSALILLGSSLLYSYTGLTHFEAITSLATVTPSYSDNIHQGILLGVVIIGVGFLFKIAAAPFHHWAPDVYDGVPTIVTTWLTVMPKISILVFLLSLPNGISLFVDATMSESLGAISGKLGCVNLWQNLILTSSVLSLVIGTVVGLAQYRLKRLLAYSTISHVGFLLLALSVNTEEAICSFIFYLVQYSLTNLDAFCVVLAMGYVLADSLRKSAGLQNNKNEGNHGVLGATDIQYISQLKGQFYANPILGLSLAICLFSIAGIPPLVGFFAKYEVLYAAIHNGNSFLALIGILASVVSAAYYLRVVRVIHFDTSSTPGVEEVSEGIHGVTHNGIDGSVGNANAPYNASIGLTSAHSYIIAVLTLFVLLFISAPSLLLNSSQLLALSIFSG